MSNNKFTFTEKAINYLLFYNTAANFCKTTHIFIKSETKMDLMQTILKLNPVCWVEWQQMI